MNSISKKYIIVWAVILAIFNAIAFVSPGWTGLAKYTGSFWAGYIFVTIAFVANLCLTLWAFKDANNNAKRMFYNLPVIAISYSMLVVALIVGALTMLNSLLPTGIAIVLLLILVAFYTVSIISSKVAIEAVQGVDAKIETNTSFMKDLRARSEALTKIASTDEIKQECNKVYEAIRYSDPVSSFSTKEIEDEIASNFEQFEKAVQDKDDTLVKKWSRVLLDVVSKRNTIFRKGS